MGDDTANFNTWTILTTFGGNSLHCNHQLLNCPIKWSIDCRASGKVGSWCWNTDINPKDECEQQIFDIVSYNIREYKASTINSNGDHKFDTEYYPYTKTIND